MGVLRFIWAVVVRDVALWPRLVQFAVVAVPLMVGLFERFLDEPLLLPGYAWVVVAVTLAAVIIIFRLAQRGHELERAFVPMVTISDPIIEGFPKAKAKQKTDRYASIHVRNVPTASLKNCCVKLVEFVNRRGEADDENREALSPQQRAACPQ